MTKVVELVRRDEAVRQLAEVLESEHMLADELVYYKNKVKLLLYDVDYWRSFAQMERKANDATN